MTASGPTSASRPPGRLVLASQSPRRRRLLSWLGVPFEVAAVDTPEEIDTPLAECPEALAQHLAAEKAAAARDEGIAADALVLTFDTIVVHEGRVLGKPADVEDAWRMLRSLSGRVHEVVTGVSVLCPGDATPATFAVTTRVTMKSLGDPEIEAWMASGEFMGCAGAYNIEGQVAEVDADECYQNVAGTPLCHLYAHLVQSGDPSCVPPAIHPPIATCDAALKRTCRLGPATIGAPPR